VSTLLYLLRHAATPANLACPPRLQGRRHDPPLAPLGILQTEAARDRLAALPLRRCSCSPMLRAAQTAALVAAPHGLCPEPVEALAECDVGRWEGLDWQTVRYLDADAYSLFQLDPAAHGYPGGESLADVHRRCAPVLERLLTQYADGSLLVVTHQVVLRVFLAGLLGLPLCRARELRFDNASLSVVSCDSNRTSVLALNDTAHLAHLRPHQPAA
jgi:broad specificity phosphatase PhoE